MSAVDLTLDRLIAERWHAPVPGVAPTGNAPWSGPFRGARRGQGIDIDDLRAYAPGDDVRHIDWKVSARRGETITRLYREEKDHAATVVLDLGDTLFTGSRRLRSVTAGLAAARALWRRAAEGSRVTAVVHDADGLAGSRASAGETGALDGCALIAARHGRRIAALVDRRDGPTVHIGASPAFASLVESLLSQRRRLGSVTLISGLDAFVDDGREAAGAALTRLALAASTTLLLVEDPIERVALPRGRYRFRDGPHVRAQVVGRSSQRRLAATLADDRAAVDALCRQIGVTMTSIDASGEARERTAA